MKIMQMYFKHPDSESQAWVADKLGYHKSYISQCSIGTAKLPRDKLFKFYKIARPLLSVRAQQFISKRVAGWVDFNDKQSKGFTEALNEWK